MLDASGGRVLHASPRGAAFRRAISESDGRVAPALGLGEQITRARLRPDRPLLLRLRLDARRLAPPVLVTLMRMSLTDTRDVVVLVANAPLPDLRANLRGRETSAPDSSEGHAEPCPAPAPGDPRACSPELAAEAPEPLVVRQRFTWESDAAGTIVQVSQVAGSALRRRLQGRTWHALAEAAVLRDAGGLLAALESGRTFRAIPITMIDAGGAVCELELSGAPASRSASGFRGFGQVRSIADAPPEPDAAKASPAPEPVVEASEPSASAPDVGPTPSDPHLSTHEHAAFREIARALGARFAGDERPDHEAEPNLPCAVMPFPVQPPRPAGDAAPDAAMVATLERIPSGVLVYRDETVLFANRPLLDLVGYANHQELTIAGGVDHLFGGVDPRRRSAGDAPLILATREGGRTGVLIEHSVLDWAGRPADLLLARDAEPSAEARAATATAIAQDFAARHGSEALAVLAALEDGIVLLDHQARILSLNRRSAEIFGLDPREVVGASFLGLFASEHAVDLLARLHVEPGSTATDDVPAAARGSRRRLRVKVLPLAGDAENRQCAVIRDDVPASERREANVREQSAAQGHVVRQAELLTQVGRTVQAPVKGMLSSIEGLISESVGPPGSEQYRACLQEVRASGASLLDLVNDLLDLARIESGKIDLAVAEVSLNDVVTRCVAGLQPEASRRRIVLRTSFSTDLPSLMADERSVHQATVNVIANAIALTEAGGQVIVSTTLADRGEIALRIRDTGTGMTAAEVEDALKPFGTGATAAPRRGTGLGLPLTKALVEANHGRFRISSRKEEGTLVEMLFPVCGATMRA
ncbi:ATP-binding protein [Methylobacterium sp. M6A4_1b]